MRLHSINGNEHVRTQEQLADERRRDTIIRGGLYPVRFHLFLLNNQYKMYYNLMFHHIQVAMARHRYYGSPRGQVDTLHYTVCQMGYERMPTMIFDIEARSVSDYLLLRTQHVIEMDRHSSV